MIEKGDRVVCGVSAGPDSVCLFCCLNELKDELGFDIAIVHVNHGIRGKEAERDEHFAMDLAAGFGIPAKTYRFDVPEIASEKRLTEEEAGRLVRKEAFRDYMEETGASKLALAHNANDVAETVIMNLARGTGLAGLCGILPVKDEIIRPLIFEKRCDIESYLKEKGIHYLTDSTNNEDEYTRNRIRHHVIPYLEENINRRTIDHISECAAIVSDAVRIIDSTARDLSARCIKKVSGGVLIENEVFEAENESIAAYVIRNALSQMTPHLKDIGREHISYIIRLYNMPSGRRIDLPYKITGEKCSGGILILNEQPVADGEKPIALPGITEAFGYRINALCNADVPVPVPDITYTKWMDYDRIKGSLCIRTRRKKDRIVIDGKGGTKKVSDYMTDAKIPRYLRDVLPVIADDEYVLWIPGYRMGENIKVTPETVNAVRLELIVNESKILK